MAEEYEIYEIVEIGGNDAFYTQPERKDFIGLRVKKFKEEQYKQQYEGWYSGAVEFVSEPPESIREGISIFGKIIYNNPNVGEFIQIKLQPIE